jgi:hypothetical protein
MEGIKINCGFSGLAFGITLIFILMRIFGIVNWPWYILITPIWVPWLMFALAWLIIYTISFLLKDNIRRW